MNFFTRAPYAKLSDLTNGYEMNDEPRLEFTGMYLDQTTPFGLTSMYADERQRIRVTIHLGNPIQVGSTYALLSNND